MPTNFLLALIVTVLLVISPAAHAYSAEEKVVESQDILISAIGDNTLGYDDDFGIVGRFDSVLKSVNDDYSYPFKNVYDILSKDDITIGNLETTLTTATKRATKKFRFHGKTDYANILTEGSVEVVNLANNHTLDYFDKGYKDTMVALKDHDIAFFGYENTSIKLVNGVKVGMFGYTGWSFNAAAKANILKSIKKLKDEGAAIIIATYHWGIERENYPNEIQKSIAHFSIDNGVDLVLGHHPHVIQGLELYKGKYIAYSLANFVFGGNRNPNDKDTFILQVKFSKTDTNSFTESINVIPCSVSSKKDVNNYQPTPLQGKDKQRVLDRLNKYSLKAEHEIGI
jgi:poly-gamma-glutamate capsule biosynthesis protein CapA/YwtB (metallophosphatase superfamily)